MVVNDGRTSKPEAEGLSTGREAGHGHEGPRRRRPYEAPRFEHLGNLYDRTFGGSAGTGDSGAPSTQRSKGAPYIPLPPDGHMETD
jgi:hypothetical protein